MIGIQTYKEGNLVMFGEIEIRIEQIKGDDVIFEDKSTGPSDKIKPVILTPKRVLNLGFNKVSTLTPQTDISILSKYSGNQKGFDVWHYHKSDIFRSGIIGQEYQPIQYVHELQNLYNDQMGEPL
jgi:hypothetical protein